MEVIITKEFITLGQLLKEVGVIQTGGAAKEYLSQNFAIVAGEKENRRGRKIYPGMQVSFVDEEDVFVRSETEEEKALRLEDEEEKKRVEKIVRAMNAQNKNKNKKKRTPSKKKASPKFPGMK